MPRPRPRHKLLLLAQNEVHRCLKRLPADLRLAAEECPVSFEEELPEDESHTDEEVLGLFEGRSRLEAAPQSLEEMPCIRLFLCNLWAFAGEDPRYYRWEVSKTYLHELGHYLGWDAEEVEMLGL